MLIFAPKKRIRGDCLDRSYFWEIMVIAGMLIKQGQSFASVICRVYEGSHELLPT